MAPSGWISGVVKAVPSGDSLLIMGKAAPGTLAPEKVITLSSLIAPRLGRRGENATKDEPFAWAAREFLRTKCIGQTVTFRTDYVVASISREFGSVFLGQENLNLAVVQAGFAKVRQGGGDAAPNHEDLLRAEQEAQAAGAGLWTKDANAAAQSVRKLDDAQDASLEQLKGRPLAAVVEACMNGGCLRLSTNEHRGGFTIFLAGVQCPSLSRRPEPGAEAPAEPAGPEPFAREAKAFAEARVLHRGVRATVEGADKWSNLVGNVALPPAAGKEGPAGDLAEELARAGLARVVERSIAQAAGGGARLRAAERAAKEARLGIWRDWAPPASSVASLAGTGANSFTGRVVEVVSGDVVSVLVDAPAPGHGAERRVSLASIRAPRMGNARKEEKPAPYAYEAKEFLRSRLIGRQVRVQIDYVRSLAGPEAAEGAAAPAAAPARRPGAPGSMEFGTVWLEEGAARGEEAAAGADGARPSVAELAVMRGLAVAVRHRGDEERSGRYDDILMAEERAKKEKKGVHGGREPPPRHVNDISRDANRARQHLPFLQRAGRTKCLVEYVLSGHKVKLLVVKENVEIVFALAGVRCPGPGEPAAEQALLYTRRHFMQRDCEAAVEAADRGGTFLGSLSSDKGLNLARALLEQGLAQTTHGIDSRPDAKELLKAEEDAKAAKKGLWAHYVEPVAAAPEDEDARPPELVPAVVTEVPGSGGGRLWLQLRNSPELEELEAAMAALNAAEPGPAAGLRPAAGAMCAGRFSGDGLWYRAYVLRVHGPDAFEVVYADYGNGEVLSAAKLAPLEPRLAARPPAARLCQLAFVKVPERAEDYGLEALQALSEMTMGKKFQLRVEGREPAAGRSLKAQLTSVEMFVTLLDGEEEGAESVNGWMVAEGLARVAPGGQSQRSRAAAEKLRDVQEQAAADRVGMWVYGDVTDDPVERMPPSKAGAGARRAGR